MKDSTVKDLDELYKHAKSARNRLEPDWFMNLAFFQGNQWLAFDAGRLYRPNMPKSKLTYVDNRIQPIVRKEIARMTKNRPVFTVTPNTSDESDSNAAELGEQLMRYLWKHLKLSPLTREALLWSRICGSGFLKCYWDSTIGDKIDVHLDPQGQVLMGANGQKVPPELASLLPGVTKKTIAQGDLTVEVRSPFQMFIDPLASTFDQAEWAIEESIKSEDYVLRRYNVALKGDTPANPGLVEARMGTTGAPGGSGYRGVKIREYWCKPNPDHPNGCRTVWAKDKILETDSNPCDPMPYVMFTGIQIPGRLLPGSIVDQLRGPQTALNKAESQLDENMNRVGNPTMVVSKQAVQNPDKLIDATMVPGGVIWIDDIGSPNATPQFLAAPALPEYVTNRSETITQSLQEISGQHEVSSAQVPPGVTAASAINLLLEQDDTMLAPSVEDYELNIGTLGQKLLELAAKYYTDARTIRIGGENGAWQIFDFRGSMLNGNTHVEVQAGSAFPQSKAAKQAQFQDMLTFMVQSGNPIKGRQLAQWLSDMNIGAYDRLVEQYSDDEEQCNRENTLMMQGQQLPINPYDNDEAHIENHTSFQKQAHYAGALPQIKAIIEQHVDMHRQRVAAQQQAQAQMAMQMQGVGQQEQGPDPTQVANQQLAIKGGQADQQNHIAMAQAEMQQRHAQELHDQKIAHQNELHQAQLRQANQQSKPQGRSQ